MLAAFKTLQYVKAGETVLIFPEGRCSKEDILEFQRGIEIFCGEARKVMFVNIRGFTRTGKMSVFLNTKRHIIFGEVMDWQGKSVTAQEVRQHIRELSIRADTPH